MPNKTLINWFAYGRKQSLGKFINGQHLIWPVLSTDSNYVFDDEAVMFTGGGNGPYYGLQIKNDTNESLFYIQAILNYWLIERLVKYAGSTFKGGYYSHGKQFIKTLPIYKINFDDSQQVAIHDKIVKNVHSIMDLEKQKLTIRTTTQRNIILRALNEKKKQIESALDLLYGISNNGTDE